MDENKQRSPGEAGGFSYAGIALEYQQHPNRRIYGLPHAYAVYLQPVNGLFHYV